MSGSNDNDPPEKQKVGYGRPPMEHRFKKGVSGNPKGRPRKKRSGSPEAAGDDRLSRLILEEAYRSVQIRENGKTEELPMIQVVLRSLGVAAVKGSHRAQLAIANLVQAVEKKQLDLKHELFEVALNYKKDWDQTIAECKARGVEPPNPVPHPDEIVFDSQSGEVLFNGPKDEMEKAEWDKLLAEKADAEEEIARVSNILKRSKKNREYYERLIASSTRIRDSIAAMVPDEETRRVPGFNLRAWQERQGRLLELRESWGAQRDRTG